MIQKLDNYAVCPKADECDIPCYHRKVHKESEECKKGYSTSDKPRCACPKCTKVVFSFVEDLNQDKVSKFNFIFKNQ
jgi:hypothetical protein